MPLIECYSCNKSLPHEAFPPAQLKPKFGKPPQCRTCRNNENAFHRLRQSNTNSTLSDEAVFAGEKRCPKCRVTQSKSEFGRNNDRKDCLQGYCRLCRHVAAAKYRQRLRSGEPPSNLRRNGSQVVAAIIGVSLADYERMHVEQDGCCAICGRAERGGRRLSVDHRHSDGLIRGLLCNGCNRGIGYFKESRLWLFAAADYLLKHESRTPPPLEGEVSASSEVPFKYEEEL